MSRSRLESSTVVVRGRGLSSAAVTAVAWMVCLFIVGGGAVRGATALRSTSALEASIPALSATAADADPIQSQMDRQTAFIAAVANADADEDAEDDAEDAADAEGDEEFAADEFAAPAHASPIAEMAVAPAIAPSLTPHLSARRHARFAASRKAMADAAGMDASPAMESESLLQVKTAAEVAEADARRPRGIGYIALPRKDGTMTRVDYARKLWRERIRRRLKGGGMMRRYAPELFGADIYGADDNDNVAIGSRATIADALNGPFAPLPKPSAMRPAVNPAALKKALWRDAQSHAALDKAQGLRHSEYYLKNDPYRNAYTYVPKNHRNPFGFSRIAARARQDQGLDIGPFDGQRFAHTYANPTLAFEKGGMKNTRLPLPSNPRLPFAEADAAIQGMRPSKLQAFPEFKPPPKIPKIAPGPAQGGADSPTNGKGDTPE